MTWHHDLDALVRRGRDVLGDVAVADALIAAADALTAAGARQFNPPVPVLGIAPCAAGALGVVVRPGGRVTVHVARSADALLDHVAEQLEEAGLLVLEATEVPDDAEERLDAAGLRPPPWYAGSGFERDDLLAACYAVVADQPRGTGASSASRR